MADSRVSPVLLPRTFRHYVTLGIIHPGMRVGRQAVCGCRHFLQALLVRRLLADGVPARRMAELVSGSGDDELKRMILDGVEMMVRPGAGNIVPARIGFDSVFSDSSESWRRSCVATGVDLYLRRDIPRLKAADRRKLLEGLEEVLERHGI